MVLTILNAYNDPKICILIFAPTFLLPGGRKMGQFEGMSTLKICPTLYDAFMAKSISKCYVFTYSVQHFQ